MQSCKTEATRHLGRHHARIGGSAPTKPATPLQTRKRRAEARLFPIPKLMQSAGAVQDHGLAARMQHAIGLLFLQYAACHFA